MIIIIIIIIQIIMIVIISILTISILTSSIFIVCDDPLPLSFLLLPHRPTLHSITYPPLMKVEDSTESSAFPQ
jgi:hypothetical protein